MEKPVLYREVQCFRQPWLWALLILLLIMLSYAIIQQLVRGKPVGQHPVPDAVLMVIGVLCGIGLPLLLYSARLILEIREDGFYFRFVPFHRIFRKIQFAEIRHFEARTYHPIREFGGWGLRFGHRCRAYNVSGNRGMQLELHNGNKILFGSQEPERLVLALASVQIKYDVKK